MRYVRNINNELKYYLKNYTVTLCIYFCILKIVKTTVNSSTRLEMVD